MSQPVPPPASTPDSTTTPAAEKQRVGGPARLVSEVFSPPIVLVVLLLAVAWHAAESWGQAVVTGLVAAAFTNVLPMGFIIVNVRRGRLGDKHVVDHRQRRTPLLVILASTVIGTGILAMTDAPRELLALESSLIAALLVAVPITILTHWGVSLHALVITGTAGAFTVVFGPALAVCWLLVPVVCWARLRVEEHTAGQVVAGTIIGAAACGLLFPFLAG